MKTSLVAFTAASILIDAAHADDCDIAQLKPLFLDTDVVVCTEDSGLSLIPSVKPSREVLSKLCASDACQKMLTTLRSLRMGDCTLLDIQLETDLLTPAVKACTSNSTRNSTSVADGDKTPEIRGTVESAEPSQATKDSSDFAPGTVKTSDIANTVDSQTSANNSSADDSAMTTTKDAAKASVYSSAVSSTVATTTAIIMAATLVLQLV
ncbi:Elicitin-like protein [Globisporangium polare]